MGELDGTRQAYYENGIVRLRENYRKGPARWSCFLSTMKREKNRPGQAQFKAGIALADRVAVEGILV